MQYNQADHGFVFSINSWSTLHDSISLVLGAQTGLYLERVNMKFRMKHKLTTSDYCILIKSNNQVAYKSFFNSDNKNLY